MKVVICISRRNRRKKFSRELGLLTFDLRPLPTDTTLPYPAFQQRHILQKAFKHVANLHGTHAGGSAGK